MSISIRLSRVRLPIISSVGQHFNPIKTRSSIRVMSTSPQGISLEQIETLKQQYTACDIADALLKLKVPGAGFLPDLNPIFKSANSSNEIALAPVSTVVFVPKNSTDLAKYPAPNIPDGKHWVDLTIPNSIIVISQPEGQNNAVLGGIMALRAKVLDARGIVVSGRVRDLDELEATGLPVSC
jgi:regulator of RNase E activity RraA